MKSVFFLIAGAGLAFGALCGEELAMSRRSVNSASDAESALETVLARRKGWIAVSSTILRFSQRSFSSTWEAFVPGDDLASPYGNHFLTSCCHAWSCGPTYLLRSPRFHALSSPSAPRYDSFRPGEEWLDTDGKPIQAHAGSLIVVDCKRKRSRAISRR